MVALKWNFLGSAVKCHGKRSRGAEHGQETFWGFGEAGLGAGTGVNGLHGWFNRYKFIDRYDEQRREGVRH
jgi:hypothetical protein